VALSAWTVINPKAGELLRLDGNVLLVAAVAGLMIARAWREAAEVVVTADGEATEPVVLRRAA
jgi:hypothetical protein